MTSEKYERLKNIESEIEFAGLDFYGVDWVCEELRKAWKRLEAEPDIFVVDEKIKKEISQ